MSRSRTTWPVEPDVQLGAGVPIQGRAENWGSAVPEQGLEMPACQLRGSASNHQAVGGETCVRKRGQQLQVSTDQAGARICLP